MATAGLPCRLNTWQGIFGGPADFWMGDRAAMSFFTGSNSVFGVDADQQAIGRWRGVDWRGRVMATNISAHAVAAHEGRLEFTPVFNV